ncbi:MAG: hypothetical protein ACRD6W_19690 [Nitrososphaerales archaeon]
MNRALEDVEAIRKQCRKMRPENCCKKTTVTQGTHTGEKETVPACALDCPWQELDRLVAIALVDVELATK